jgi:hypothetical protein
MKSYKMYLQFYYNKSKCFIENIFFDDVDTVCIWRQTLMKETTVISTSMMDLQKVFIYHISITIWIRTTISHDVIGKTYSISIVEWNACVLQCVFMLYRIVLSPYILFWVIRLLNVLLQCNKNDVHCIFLIFWVIAMLKYNLDVFAVYCDMLYLWIL